MQANLKLAARVARLSPKIARAQTKVVETTTGVWKNVAREGMTVISLNLRKQVFVSQETC